MPVFAGAPTEFEVPEKPKKKDIQYICYLYVHTQYALYLNGSFVDSGSFPGSRAIRSPAFPGSRGLTVISGVMGLVWSRSRGAVRTAALPACLSCAGRVRHS